MRDYWDEIFTDQLVWEPYSLQDSGYSFRFTTISLPITNNYIRLYTGRGNGRGQDAALSEPTFFNDLSIENVFSYKWVTIVFVDVNNNYIRPNSISELDALNWPTTFDRCNYTNRVDKLVFNQILHDLHRLNKMKAFL